MRFVCPLFDCSHFGKNPDNSIDENTAGNNDGTWQTWKTIKRRIVDTMSNPSDGVLIAHLR